MTRFTNFRDIWQELPLYVRIITVIILLIMVGMLIPMHKGKPILAPESSRISLTRPQ